jgi:plasmid maintenance system antidote protein VapI
MAVPGHDWYLKEWMATLGKKQADIVSDLEWNPARISLMLRGKQQYTRDAVNELSAYLNLQPFELLMHPEDAMALRQLRATALRIAADSQKDDDAEDVRSTG